MTQAAARILIVDDEPSILATMAPLLRGRGYEVATATSGHAALDAVDRQPPQLVILDLGLPDLDGVEVCRRLQGRARHPDPGALGARRRAGQGGGARCRGRRLRHQAVRRRGAAGARRGRAARTDGVRSPA
jgi:CheY-like chemotaxis protein